MSTTSDKKLARDIMERHEGMKYTEALRFVLSFKRLRNDPFLRAALEAAKSPGEPSWHDEERRRILADRLADQDDAHHEAITTSIRWKITSADETRRDLTPRTEGPGSTASPLDDSKASAFAEEIKALIAAHPTLTAEDVLEIARSGADPRRGGTPLDGWFSLVCGRQHPEIAEKLKDPDGPKWIELDEYWDLRDSQEKTKEAMAAIRCLARAPQHYPEDRGPKVEGPGDAELMGDGAVFGGSGSGATVDDVSAPRMSPDEGTLPHDGGAPRA